jgi:hypothetical protein
VHFVIKDNQCALGSSGISKNSGEIDAGLVEDVRPEVDLVGYGLAKFSCHINRPIRRIQSSIVFVITGGRGVVVGEEECVAVELGVAGVVWEAGAGGGLAEDSSHGCYGTVQS